MKPICLSSFSFYLKYYKEGIVGYEKSTTRIVRIKLESCSRSPHMICLISKHQILGNPATIYNHNKLKIKLASLYGQKIRTDQKKILQSKKLPNKLTNIYNLTFSSRYIKVDFLALKTATPMLGQMERHIMPIFVLGSL